MKIDGRRGTRASAIGVRPHVKRDSFLFSTGGTSFDRSHRILYSPGRSNTPYLGERHFKFHRLGLTHVHIVALASMLARSFSVLSESVAGSRKAARFAYQVLRPIASGEERAQSYRTQNTVTSQRKAKPAQGEKRNKWQGPRECGEGRRLCRIRP